MLWVGDTHLASDAGIDAELDRLKSYVRHGTTSTINEAAFRTFLERAPEALDFLDEIGGIPWQLVRDSPDYLHPIAE